MSRANNVVAFTDTIGPLALAPLAGVAVLTYTTLRDAGGNWMIAPYLALRIAPFCYGFAVLLVCPILAIRPALRRPSYVTGASWGILSAWTAIVLFAWVVGQRFPKTIPWQGLLDFGAAGAASGLLYTFVVRRRRHTET